MNRRKVSYAPGLLCPGLNGRVLCARKPCHLISLARVNTVNNIKLTIITKIRETLISTVPEGSTKTHISVKFTHK